MYITSVPNRNSPPAILLRESYRENGKVKNRTLANLSSWSNERIEAFRRILKAEPGQSLSAFEVRRSLPYGDSAAVVGVMNRLGLPKILGSRPSRERDLCTALIAERVLRPASKMSTVAAWSGESRQSALPDVLGLGEVNLDEVYAAMDWLVSRQPHIEKKLAAKHLGPGALALYDLTSVWVEGQHCELAKHGYSRDHRPEKLQIEFGLLADKDGRPIAVEVVPGNTADPSTVPAIVRKLRDRFKVDRVVLVGDRGMLTSARIREDIRPVDGLDFVTALRKSTIRKLLSAGEFQLSLFDQQDLAEISSTDFPGERLVVCRNPLRADTGRTKRWTRINKAVTDLQRVVDATRRENRPLRGADRIAMRVGSVFGKRQGVRRFFTIEIQDDALTFSIDHAAVKEDEKLDGIYVIRTSVDAGDLDTEAVVRTYKRLAKVERSFRSLKTVDLQVRPLFHRRASRVRAHVLLCMLALYVKVEIERLLAPLLFVDEDPAAGEALRSSVVQPAQRSPAAEDKADKRRTADEQLPVQSLRCLLRHLATMANNQVVPDDAVTDGFWTITRPTALQSRAFELLGVDYLRP